MSVLDDLGTLLGKAASLSLPGIVAACAFAVYLWPPLPVDTIEIVKVCPAQSDQCSDAEKTDPCSQPKTKPSFVESGTSVEFPLVGDKESLADVAAYTAEAGEPVCSTGAIDLTRQTAIFDYTTPINIQHELDCQTQIYQKCQEQESAVQGQEETLIADVNGTITQLNTELAKVDDAYQGYAASNNPLEDTFKAKLDRRKFMISQWQAVAIQLKLIEQERSRRVQDLIRQQKILSDRQADPGRLRPRQRFDDVMSSLGSHLTGFVALALAWSMLLTPVSQALFSALYASAYKYNWDYVRKDRGPPIKDLERIAEQVSSGS